MFVTLIFRFPCSRWFGRGVDDGSLERLLVAEPLNSPDASTSGGTQDLYYCFFLFLTLLNI